jgi:hypothetical protein
VRSYVLVGGRGSIAVVSKHGRAHGVDIAERDRLDEVGVDPEPLGPVFRGLGSSGLGGLGGIEPRRSRGGEVAQRTIQDAAENGMALAYDFADERLGESGQAEDALRADARRALEVKRSEFHSLGLVLGYDYAGSRIVSPDGGLPPETDPIIYRPSAAPGCLLPHSWLPDGRSLYDVLGDGFTLLVDADSAAEALNRATGWATGRAADSALAASSDVDRAEDRAGANA